MKKTVLAEVKVGEATLRIRQDDHPERGTELSIFALHKSPEWDGGGTSWNWVAKIRADGKIKLYGGTSAYVGKAIGLALTDTGHLEVVREGIDDDSY